MKLVFLFAALAWGQESAPSKLQPGELTEIQLREQISEQKQEIDRLTRLLNWYQQQFFALQARQIEQQIAPKEPPKPVKPPAQGEPAPK